uniref:Uncharacterized protein n=1 Tax=Chenopodium quinoa TaxID=63459 RepID=A0A803MU67_CHEQI
MQGGRKVHKFGAKIFSPKSRSYRFQAIEEEGYTQLHSAIEVGDRDFVVAFVGQNNGSIMRQKVGVNLTWKTALVMLKHQKLGKCPGYTEFKDELKNVIYDSLDMVEFELSNEGFVLGRHEYYPREHP